VLRADGRERLVRWRGLRADLHAHPEVPEVRALGRVHESLRRLMNRPTLQREP
jgi:hypothetical protein